MTLTDVDTFVRPVYVTAPPGDGERLMVVLIDGSIRVVRKGITLAQPFLTIPDVDNTDEGGLLSMAFAPDYLASGRFYVFMVSDDANPGGFPHGPVEIREYRRSAANPEVADPATKRTVLTIPHLDSATHNGGTLQFGPDGLLYASVGDGGGANDPGGDAQNTSSQLGKLLRFDPRPLGSAPYRVPADNPFADGQGGDPLVYSYGLRNPFRFSFDRENGDLTIGDVGQGKWEEIDFVTNGGGWNADFGWADCEGLVQQPDDSQPCTTGTLPVHVYSNPEPGCAAVTGGVVVRDPGLEELEGKYLYGDFCATYVKSLDLPPPTNETTLSVSVPAFRLVAFGEDACGRVHLVLLDTGSSSTPVQRLEDESPSPCNLRVNYFPPAAAGGQSATTPALSGLVLSLGGATRQRPLLSGHVGVRVRCGGACSVRALGHLSLKQKGKRIRLRQALGRRSSSGTLTLRLRVPAKARKALRRALLGRKAVRAALTVRVRDAAGKLSSRRRTVRLVR